MDKTIQTAVTFHDGWLEELAKIEKHGGKFPLAAVHFQSDVVNGIPRVTVFANDGHDNGLPILSFDTE